MQAAARQGRGKVSEYGKQLLEKQRVCYMYGLTDKQLNALFNKASATVGQTDTLIHTFLESRLDSALYRSGFAKTRLQSRQFISHGMFTVNGVRVTIPSYRVKQGDIVKVRDNRKQSPVFIPIVAAHEKYVAPAWMKTDPAQLSFEVIELPANEMHFERAIDMRKVIGFYSR
jgi:small subunit ribosomal protein S4